MSKKIDPIKRKLLTRQEIIDYWKTGAPEYLNSFCCPNCRDLLFDRKTYTYEEDSNYFYCWNFNCRLYNIPLENT